MGRSCRESWRSLTAWTSSSADRRTRARREETSTSRVRSFSKRLMPDAYLPVVLMYLRMPEAKWFETRLGTWTSGSELNWRPELGGRD